MTANEGILASLQGGVDIILRARSIGSGRPLAFVGTDPGVGVEWNETVPDGKYWRLISVASLFTCDATIITRSPAFAIAGPSMPDSFVALAGIQIANQVFTRTWAIVGDAEGTFAVSAMIPIANIMGPGFTFRSVTGNLQAGDDWGPPSVWVEEWDVDDD